MRTAVIDIGKPGKHLGWSIDGANPAGGDNIDDCIGVFATALNEEGLALGFEAPMFVPMRNDPFTLTKARQGECGNGFPNRPFSAAAGTSVLVTALVVVPYVLSKLRKMSPGAIATLEWRSQPKGPAHLLLFEAFVSNQKKTSDTRHEEDARLAVEAFNRGMADRATFKSAVEEPDCLSLLGAMMLRTGWATDPKILQESCLVVRV